MAPNARTAEHHDDPPAYSWYHAWDPKTNGLMSDQQKAVVMDWIEQGIDFFGCDENSSPRKVFGDSLRHLHRDAEQEVDYQSLDYAKLHDQLLESLMAEQSKKATDDNMPPPDLESSASSFSFTMSQCSNHSHPSFAMNASASSVNSSFDSYAIDDKLSSRPEEGVSLPESLPEQEALSTTTTASSTLLSRSSSSSRRGLKRPRALKLHRRVMPALSSSTSQTNKKEMKRQVSSASSVSSKSTCKSESLTRTQSDAVRVSLSHLAESHLPAASTFLHPQCRLQKDKGKGEPAGSNICAKGRDHCLHKLEQKIALLTRVAFGEEGAGAADMKQRPARVAEVFPNFTETRSIIELRMGFLSMQYGILLRWDTTRTGKATLVVLRKMCPESFYTKCKPTKKVQSKQQQQQQRRPLAPHRKSCMMPTEPPSIVIRNVIDGNHAILQRPDGMEVALLEPPYRVDRPDEFQPTLLSVAVQCGTGLRRKSSWTVQLAYDGRTENILMTWDTDGTLTPKLGDTLKHEIATHGAVDLASLEIRLFEHRQRRGKSRRCVSQMTVPLLGLEAQPTHKPPTPSDLKVACSHDPDATLTLSVLLQSDYAHWLRRELDARRREEVKGVMWKSPFRVVDADEEEEEEDSIWEWICGAC